jgi:hypothetical protein
MGYGSTEYLTGILTCILLLYSVMYKYSVLRTDQLMKV